MIFDDRYKIILSACQDLRRRREQLVGPVIAGQILGAVDMNVPSDRLLSHIVAEALLRRVDRELLTGKNIYLQQFEMAQIDLFDVARRLIPQIPQSYAVANQYLAATLQGLETAALLEIGAGKGAQLLALLRLLAAAPGRLQQLRIVALDPVGPCLVEAQAAIEALAPSLPFGVEVRALRVLFERCPLTTLQDAIGRVDGLAINAAFTLHHITHVPGEQELRTQLLRDLASLKPRVMTLIEPHANHDTELLTRRVHSCWEHFGTVFDLIDQSEGTPLEKFALKEVFFGREVRDILGTSDVFRCERHEPYESWLLRLTKAGLRPASGIDLSITLPDYCWAIVRDGLVRLGYHGVPLIAVFAYRSPEAS